LLVLKSPVNAFLREVRGRFRFWGLFVVDEDILVILVQAVNPHGGSVGEEGAVFFYSEGHGQGRRFAFPAVEDEGRVVTGSEAQLAKVGAREQQLKEGIGRHAGRQIPFAVLFDE
jgi:hypothetical protein